MITMRVSFSTYLVCMDVVQSSAVADLGIAEWDFVSINAGFGSAGFFFNETGLQYDQDLDGFAGWLGKQV